MTALLEVERLTVAFGEKETLSEVSFSVAPGQCVGIVGETGSGKSMICHVITGTLRRLGGRVVSGSVRFQGEELAGLDERGWERLRGRRIALVPQASMSGLNPVRTVRSHLRETIAVLEPGLDRAQRPVRAAELLDSVGLSETQRVLGSYPHQLSGGMRQRVMIALALVGSPELLVADEPTTALDVTVQEGILSLLDGLRRERGLAMVFVTHDLGVIEQVSERLVVLRRGGVVESGPTDAVMTAPGDDYTRMLVAARLYATPDVAASTRPETASDGRLA